MCKERRLVLQHCITHKDNFFMRQNNPDRTWGGAWATLKEDGCIAPVQSQLIEKGDFRRRPSNTSQAGDRFPISAGLITLRFEGIRTVTESLRSFLVCNHGAVHGTHAQGSVWVRVQIDQYAFRTVAHTHHCSTPRTTILRRGRRVDLD